MKRLESSPLCCWEFRGRSWMAYAAGERRDRFRAVQLFPRTTFKWRLFRRGVHLLMEMRLDAWFCSWREAASEWLSATELEGLLDALRQGGGSAEFDWILTWPAQMARNRLYLVFRSREGDPAGAVKIGEGDFNRRQLHNEADTLAKLSTMAHPFSIPSVLFERNLANGCAALALGGFPRASRPVTPSQAVAFGRKAVSRLKSFPVPAPRIRMGSANWFQAFRDRAPAGAATNRLLAMADAEIDVGFAHGDLGPGNMLDDGRGGLFLLDWENASMQAPVQVDPAGLWLAFRQRQALRSPRALVPAMKKDLGDSQGNAILAALSFLCAHGNLAASKMLEAWE